MSRVDRVLARRYDQRVVDDVELLERWRAGEAPAGEALFERYFNAVVRFFRNKVTDGTDDLVQRTFLACVEGRDRLRNDATFRCYLFGVAHNLLHKHYRARKKSDLIDFTVRSVFDLGPSPSSVAAKSQTERLVLDALRRVPLEYQTVLELHYWEELTAAEIAGATEVPLGTAKTRLRRGRELLEKALTELATAAGTAAPSNLDSCARDLRSRLIET